MNTLAVKAATLAERMGASPEIVELVRSQIAPGAPDEVIALYFARCNQLGVDPLGRMLYAIPRVKNTPPDRSKTGRWEKETIWQLQSSVDLFRTVAESHGDSYAGQTGPFWCGRDAKWLDVWLEPAPPLAAKVGVYRHGFVEPLFAVATWAEYAQTDKDGAPSGMWKNMPALMLAKCAESLALRKAFPAKLTGIYTTEEMSQADNERRLSKPAAAAVPPPDGTPALKPAPDDGDTTVPPLPVLLDMHASLGTPEGSFGKWIVAQGIAPDLESRKPPRPTDDEKIAARAVLREMLAAQAADPETVEGEYQDVNAALDAAAAPEPGSGGAHVGPPTAAMLEGAPKIADQTRKALMAILRERGISERDDRLHFAYEEGIDVASFSELLEPQGQYLCKRAELLKKVAAQ